MSKWQIAANPIRQPCGCHTWDEWTGERWQHREFRCHRHGDPDAVD